MQSLLKFRTIKIAFDIVLVLLIYLALRTYLQWGLVTGPVPSLHVTTLAGKVFDITQPRQGPLLIHFWATWCPVCRLEQGSIEAISRDYPVLSIAVSSGDAGEVSAFLAQHQLHFPVVNDPAGEIAKTFGVVGVPVSFVVNEHNQIRFVERGYTTGWGLRLRLWLMGR